MEEFVFSHLEALITAEENFNKALVVGDCNKKSLRQIWESKIYQDWRKRHLDDNTKGYICYNCIYNKNEKYDSIIPGTLEKPLD